MPRWICSVAMLVLLGMAAAWAQNPVLMPPNPPPMTGADGEFNRTSMPAGIPESHFDQQLRERQNVDRQAALKRDTDKLMELATQLKQNVDRTNVNILSLDVVKKAQEIEKLAKSVKEKMKGD